MFNLSQYTPLEAAEKADLYTAFTYLSAQSAIDDFKEEYTRIAKQTK